MTPGWAQISDDAAEYLRRVMNEHVANEHGWCKACGRWCGLGDCAKRGEYESGLWVAGRLEIKPPQIVRPEPGRWP